MYCLPTCVYGRYTRKRHHRVAWSTFSYLGLASSFRSQHDRELRSPFTRSRMAERILPSSEDSNASSVSSCCVATTEGTSFLTSWANGDSKFIHESLYTKFTHLHENNKRADSFESARYCSLAKRRLLSVQDYSAASSSCSPSIRICSSSRSSASIAAVTSCCTCAAASSSSGESWTLR
jgi:hypothetical protein